MTAEKLIRLLGRSDWVRRTAGRQLLRRLNCVFVLSTGRCGTQTLASLLDEFPGIAAYHEPHPHFLKETSRLYQPDELDRRLAIEVGARFAGYRWRIMNQAERQDQWYVECSNRLTSWAYSLAEAMPNSYFIHLYRDPAAVVRSGMRRKYFDGHAWDEYRIQPDHSNPVLSEWERWSPFEKTCWLWAEVNQFVIRFSESVEEDRTLRLPAEELFAAPKSACERIASWLGVEAPTSDAISEITACPQNAQEDGAFPKWTDWTDWQQETLRTIVGDVAKKLGYFART